MMTFSRTVHFFFVSSQIAFAKAPTVAELAAVEARFVWRGGLHGIRPRPQPDRVAAVGLR